MTIEQVSLATVKYGSKCINLAVQSSTGEGYSTPYSFLMLNEKMKSGGNSSNDSFIVLNVGESRKLLDYFNKIKETQQNAGTETIVNDDKRKLAATIEKMSVVLVQNRKEKQQRLEIPKSYVVDFVKKLDRQTEKLSSIIDQATADEPSEKATVIDWE